MSMTHTSTEQPEARELAYWIAHTTDNPTAALIQSLQARVAVPDEREAFEVEILKYTPHAILDCHDGQYTNPWVQAAWTGFQVGAALAATSAPLEKLRVNPESEQVAKYVYGEKTALLDVVAMSLALESTKKQLAVSPAAAQVQLPEPERFMDDRGYTVEAKWIKSDDATSDYRNVYTQPLYTEQQVLSLLTTVGQAKADARLRTTQAAKGERNAA